MASLSYKQCSTFVEKEEAEENEEVFSQKSFRFSVSFSPVSRFFSLTYDYDSEIKKNPPPTSPFLR